MGNFFTKEKDKRIVYNDNNIREQLNREPTYTDIKNIIKKYEHIKNSKRITDIDKLIDVMNNTDWSKTNTNHNNDNNYLAEPSAPPIPLHIPIAIAHVIEVIK
jgi:hypothetical protein